MGLAKARESPSPHTGRTGYSWLLSYQICPDIPETGICVIQTHGGASPLHEFSRLEDKIMKMSEQVKKN